jgi:hypothetical protein
MDKRGAEDRAALAPQSARDAWCFCRVMFPATRGRDGEK